MQIRNSLKGFEQNIILKCPREQFSVDCICSSSTLSLHTSTCNSLCVFSPESICGLGRWLEMADGSQPRKTSLTYSVDWDRGGIEDFFFSLTSLTLCKRTLFKVLVSFSILLIIEYLISAIGFDRLSAVVVHRR